MPSGATRRGALHRRLADRLRRTATSAQVMRESFGVFVEAPSFAQAGESSQARSADLSPVSAFDRKQTLANGRFRPSLCENASAGLFRRPKVGGAASKAPLRLAANYEPRQLAVWRDGTRVFTQPRPKADGRAK